MNKIRFYYTLKDACDSDNIDNINSFVANVQAYAVGYSQPIYPSGFGPVWTILLNRHYSDYIAYKDYYFEETLADNFQPTFDTGEFYRQFYQIYLSTYERYNAILGFYNAKKAQLLDKIGSETKAKFNDTPQNGGDFDNDEHLSTITTTTTEQDLVPLINRLDDVSRLYKDVLSDWADEFAVLFIAAGDNDHE